MIYIFDIFHDFEINFLLIKDFLLYMDIDKNNKY